MGRVAEVGGSDNRASFGERPGLRRDQIALAPGDEENLSEQRLFRARNSQRIVIVNFAVYLLLAYGCQSFPCHCTALAAAAKNPPR